MKIEPAPDPREPMNEQRLAEHLATVKRRKAMGIKSVEFKKILKEKVKK